MEPRSCKGGPERIPNPPITLDQGDTCPTYLRWVGLLRILAGAIGLAACSAGALSASSPPTPSATVTSSEPGAAFDARDTAAWILTGNGAPGAALIVQIADTSGLCPMADPRTSLAGSQTIHISVGTPSPTVSAGKYNVPPTGPEQVVVWTVTADSQCVTSEAAATSGTLTLDVITSVEVSGRFDVYLPAAPDSGVATVHLSGRFVAPFCGSMTPADGGRPKVCP